MNTKNIFITLPLFLILSGAVYSQAKQEKVTPKDAFVEEDEESPAVERFRKRDFELGIRYGLGYHAEDRFESQLKNYKSESSPYIIRISSTNTSL